MAPPSPAKQWNPPRLPAAENELKLYTGRYDLSAVATIDPRKIYTLPELIDIAQSNNPQTRTAWENSRSALASVGLSKSLYYPTLAASAATEFSRMFIPFPQLSADQEALTNAISGLAGALGTGAGAGTGTGTGASGMMSSGSGGGAIVSATGGSALVSKTKTSDVALSMEWLLFDFGWRDAGVASSRAKLLGANMDFNKTHQQLVYDVTELFYNIMPRGRSWM